MRGGGGEAGGAAVPDSGRGGVPASVPDSKVSWAGGAVMSVEKWYWGKLLGCRVLNRGPAPLAGGGDARAARGGWLAPHVPHWLLQRGDGPVEVSRRYLLALVVSSS